MDFRDKLKATLHFDVDDCFINDCYRDISLWATLWAITSGVACYALEKETFSPLINFEKFYFSKYDENRDKLHSCIMLDHVIRRIRSAQGTSILQDGCTVIKNGTKSMNVMIQTADGDVFIYDSIELEKYESDGSMNTGPLIKCIIDNLANNGIYPGSICTDNAGNTIRSCDEALTFQVRNPCMAHHVNLMLPNVLFPRSENEMSFIMKMQI